MTEPDPKTVREIAREAVRRGGSDSGYGFIGSVISDHAAMDEMLASGDRAAFGRLHAAVRAELKGAAITVEWPDEQQPADVVTAEQQQDGACPCGCPTVGDMCDCGPDPCGCSPDPGCAFCDSPNDPPKPTQRQAKPMEAKQQPDGAVKDVAAFLDAWEADRGFGNTIRGGNGDMPYLFATDLRAVLAERTALAARVAELESERTEDARAVDAVAAAEDDELLDRAISNLIARFADRIAALDADTDGGAE